MSSFVFCVRTIERNVAWSDLKGTGEETKKYAKIAGNMKRVNRFLSNEIAEEDVGYNLGPLFQTLISIIYDAYQESDDDEMVESFLKKREVFLKYIAPRLRNACGVKKFKEMIKEYAE
jgi:hypothetical protein